MDLLLTAPAIKRFFYYLTLATLAVLFATQVDSTSANWFVWSLLLGAIISGRTLPKRLLAIFLTGVTATLGVFISGSLSEYLAIVSVYLFLTTLICMYASGSWADFSYPLFLLNVFILVSASFAPDNFEKIERPMFVFLGFSVCFIWQALWWLISANDELRHYTQSALANLKNLNEKIFSAFLEIEYRDNVYLFEKRIHESKNKYIQSIGMARKLYAARVEKLKEDEKIKLENTLIKMDKVFDILLDCAQLRRRVSDPTTFSLCEDELKTIHNEINTGLNNVMHLLRSTKYKAQPFMLEQGIRHLDDSYQNVLRVSAREPLVFLLLIFSLNVLNNEMQSWQEGLKNENT